jgi:hypothetical protein
MELRPPICQTTATCPFLFRGPTRPLLYPPMSVSLHPNELPPSVLIQVDHNADQVLYTGIVCE